MYNDLASFVKETEEWAKQVSELQMEVDAMNERLKQIDEYMEVIKCCECRRDQIK